MCGIAGAVQLTSNKTNKQLVRSMLSSLKHRGPDGQGEWAKDKVTMGMRRLSIIDIEGGDQPLFNEDKTIVVVGNGEIYNYVELNKKLSRGHSFATKSDIETAIHLYEDFGIEFVKKLRGMFALALHDTVKNKLFLVRDRLGEKPLYWTVVGDKLIFSSELKALIKIPGINKTLNLDAMDSYFHYYFIPEPATAFANIHKLSPSSYLEIDLDSGQYQEQKYWSPPSSSPFSGTPTDKVKKDFADACKLTLRSDVPVGISLSGGVDSGAILSFAAPAYKDTMKAFSVGYEGQPETDERKQAEALAKKFKVEFYSAELKTTDIVRDFPQLIYDSDDPIADIAAPSINAVAALAREHEVPVMLGGLGGDELFWGYPWTSAAIKKSIDAYTRDPSFIEKLLGNSEQNYLSFYDETPGFKTAQKFLQPLYSRQFASNLTDQNNLQFMKFKPTTSKTKIARRGLELIRDLWLVSNCIALSDRLSMANSVELRSPFLDQQLVETAMNSRQSVLSYDRDSKYWFKQAMRGVLPDEVMNRPKRGFTPPVANWLRGILKNYLGYTRDGFLVNEKIIDEKKMRFLVQAWPTLPMYWYPLYQLTLLELWGRMYVYDAKPGDFR